MKLSSAALQNVLDARGMTAAILAERAGLPRSRLAVTIETGEGLDEDDIVAVAEELAVPVEALFAKQKLPLFPSIDFRAAVPEVRSVQKGTLDAIAFVERLSSTFASLELSPTIDESLAPIESRLTEKEAIQLAALWRERWGVTIDQQLEWQDANKLYVSLRSFIEGLGVLVLHRSFKSVDEAGLYMKVDGGPHTIVINTTKSSKARKLFTLAHEFCHVLLRQEGVSNPSILRNRIERFCNKFAAYLLAPTKVIAVGLSRFRYTPSESDDFIRLFAKKLGISQEALILRMVEEDLLTRDFYLRWRGKFEGSVPPGDQGDGGGGGGNSDPILNKRTMYGTALLGLLEKARRLGKLDELDVFRLSGLKPKYQNRLFEAV